jgi:hypothetical protein
MNLHDFLIERSLSKKEKGKQEKIVKGMKKSKNDFKDRYGKDAEAVMYATATKLAKESVKSQYGQGDDPKADPKVVAKFADVDPKLRSYYITKWADKKGIDSDDAMFMAGYVQDGYIGAGAWNWRYVGLDEDKQRLDPKCWKGYKKQGTKMKGDVRVNNCVKEAKQALARHVKEGVPLPDSLFRYQSEAYFDTFKYAKQLREAGILQELDWESEEMLGTDIGESVVLENGETVWLDVPYLNENDLEEDYDPKLVSMLARFEDDCQEYGYYGDTDMVTVDQLLKAGRVEDAAEEMAGAMADQDGGSDKFDQIYDMALDAVKDYMHQPAMAEMRKLAGLPEAEYQGKDVELNKPKRGGSKKYYVYVKNPKTGNVKKISFGDPGLKTKSGNKGRAKSFAARHNCEKKNDKTKAGYWACRLPRYGLVKGGKWW